MAHPLDPIEQMLDLHRQGFMKLGKKPRKTRKICKACFEQQKSCQKSHLVCLRCAMLNGKKACTHVETMNI